MAPASPTWRPPAACLEVCQVQMSQARLCIRAALSGWDPCMDSCTHCMRMGIPVVNPGGVCPNEMLITQLTSALITARSRCSDQHHLAGPEFDGHGSSMTNKGRHVKSIHQKGLDDAGAAGLEITGCMNMNAFRQLPIHGHSANCQSMDVF